MVAQLGPYLIDETLAEGGMARVYRARLRGLGGFEKTLVLKQIRPELAKDPRFVEMFIREANTLVQMSHPHIVPVYELGAVDGSYYLSMEYIDGATLARLLEDGPLGPALVAQIGVQLCDALDYAHGRFSILHRDITPRNLIVDDAGHVRLLDFGIAAAFDVGGAERFGSPGYMSPEQVRGESLKPSSDLFSLGAVLYEALIGKPAFEKTIQGSLQSAPKLVDNTSLPNALSTLVDSLLAQDPAQRPQSALDMARPLREWLAQAQPEGAFTQLRERARRVRDKPRARTLGTAETTTPAAENATRALPKPLQNPLYEELSESSISQVHAFATSPVLTEMLRSASGIARPVPTAPTTGPTTALASSLPETSTRRIEPQHERSAAPAESAASLEPAAHPRATAFMLRWWPALALLAFAVAGVVMLGAPQQTRDARKQTAPAAAAERSTFKAAPARPSDATKTTESPIVAAPAAPAPVAEPGGDARGTGQQTRSEQTRSEQTRSNDTSWLTLNASPWAEVSLDGRKLGTTPLRRLKVRAGSHVLQFECPPLGKSARLNVMIERDAEATVMLDLRTDPPRTILDGATELR